jgi:hemoglobin/transferrin/lactoferrin receptor protein
MYGRWVRCSQSGAVELRAEQTRRVKQTGAARNGSHLIKKSLLLWGCAAASLALTAPAIAQSTQTLPQVTVEGKGSTAKKGTAKGTPKAAPQQPAEPVQQETQATREKAQKDAVYNTPAAVSTATRTDIETFGLLDTGDVLRSMPGTSTTENPQNPGVAVNIRGFEGSGRVNMMIDGARQNFRFTAHEAKGFAYVDPALLAGVDIMRGAVSTAGGAGALAGAANLRTLGVDDIVKPGNTTGVMSTVSYGTNGVGWSEMLAAGVKAGGIGVAGAISHHEPDNYKNGDGVTVPNTYQDPMSGLFKLDIRLSAEQSLKLGAVLYDNDFTANGSLQNLKSNTYTAKYAFKPIDNPLIDFKLNAYANEAEMKYYSGSALATGRVINDTGMGFDVSNTSRFRLGPFRVASTYGYEFFFDDVDAFNKFTPSVGGNVNPSGESSVGGAFWQTQYSYGMFDLITGLRYDTYTLKGVFDSNGTAAGGTLTTLDRSDGRLSPKVTLAAQVLPWLQPYVTYSESFRPPTISETMFGGEHPGGAVPFLPNFIPNPDLRAEVQKGWEFGANIKKDNLFARGDAFRFKAAYFNMGVEDYIQGFQFLTFPGPGAPVVSASFRNVPGTSHVQGIELEGSYDAGTVFGGLSYTYTDSNLPTQLSGVGAPTNLPEHILIVTGGVRLLEQKLTIDGRVAYYSDFDVGAENAGPFNQGFTYATRTLSGYTLVDVFTSYKVTDNLELGVLATNLFDVGHTPANSIPILPSPPSSPSSANCFGSNFPGCNDLGRGRTVLFTAKSHF